MRTMIRSFVSLVAAAILASVSVNAVAQDFPTKPVHIMVGFAAGGTGDTLARMLGEKLAQLWGQPVVVENRVGASGTIALEAVARAAPDGYTLGMLNFAHVVAAELIKLPFKIEADFAPIAGIAQQANILVVNPALPINSVPQLIEYAKARPGQLSFASGGAGSPGHVAGELFKQMTGVEMIHVPYKGGPPALQDVVAGHVALMFAPAPPALALIKGGKLRALAVTSGSPSAAMPDLPTLASSGIDYDVRDWHGLVGPAGMAPALVTKINNDVGKVLAMPEIKDRITAMTGDLLAGTPADFNRLIAGEAVKWGKVVRQAKITSN